MIRFCIFLARSMHDNLKAFKVIELWTSTNSLESIIIHSKNKTLDAPIKLNLSFLQSKTETANK